MKEIAIKVHDLDKSFDLPEEKVSSVKQLFVSLGRKRKRTKQHVLKNIKFEIYKGEFVGIVGRNGSGKSTLLKILAGVYVPDKGAVEVNGTLTPFIELGVGFNPELTARDNVFLNGSLLGFGRKDMNAMYDDIVSFAELEGFMDKKLKNFSSGMQVRLAFSISIRARSDILLLDEVLAVGDAAFQQKCFDYFLELRKRQQTVVFVSHDQTAVERYCTRAILIEKGRIVADGAPADIYAEYFKDETESESDIEVEQGRVMQHEVAEITEVTTAGTDGSEKKAFSPEDKEITVSLHVKALANITAPVYGLIIKRIDEPGIVTQTNTRVEGVVSPNVNKGE
jgi:ABC-2 type transport system ATP-binding protein